MGAIRKLCKAQILVTVGRGRCLPQLRSYSVKQLGEVVHLMAVVSYQFSRRSLLRTAEMLGVLLLDAPTGLVSLIGYEKDVVD